MGIFRKKSGERQELSGCTESNNKSESTSGSQTPERGLRIYFAAYPTVDGGVECRGPWLDEIHGVAVRLQDNRALAIFRDGEIRYFSKDDTRVDANTWKTSVRGETIPEKSSSDACSTNNGDRISVEGVQEISGNQISEE